MSWSQTVGATAGWNGKWDVSDSRGRRGWDASNRSQSYRNSRGQSNMNRTNLVRAILGKILLTIVLLTIVKQKGSD
jgi:hypothetical protein